MEIPQRWFIYINIRATLLTLSLSSTFFCKNCAYCWFYLLRYPLLQYYPLLNFSTSFDVAEFLNYLFEYCLLFTWYKQGRDLYNSMDSEMNSWGHDLMSAITPINWRNKLAVLTDWRDYTRRHKIPTLLVWTVSTLKQAVAYRGGLRDCGALDKCSVRGRRPLKMWWGVGVSWTPYDLCNFEMLL
jgi:hypothetical protein